MPGMFKDAIPSSHINETPVRNPGGSEKPIKFNCRARYQRGSLTLRGKRRQVWVGRWREDVPQPDQTVKRIHRREILGTFEDYPSKRLALRLLDEKLSGMNSFTYKPTAVSTF